MSGATSFSVAADFATVTVAQILADPGGFLAQGVDLRGSLLEGFPSGEFLFSDGTGGIPADFSAASPPPLLEAPVRVAGTVLSGLVGGFSVKIAVISWEMASAFTCDDLLEVRVRFTEPGFSFGNVVGLFLAYRGAPPGEKTVEITWDQHNPSGAVEQIAVGQGVPRVDGLFDLEGVVSHEYPGVKGTEQKTVRAVFEIAGRDGGCTRARDVTLTPGTGPSSAGGGTLQVSIDEGDVVRPGTLFGVRAKVSNQTPQSRNVQVLFHTPDRAGIEESSGTGCKVLSKELVECLITLGGGERVTRVVRYRAPGVTSSTSIAGAVTLVSGEFAPAVDYKVTVAP